MIRLPRLLLCAVACSAVPASAQTMYRCGSSFQDHPCAGGQAGQVIGNGAGADAGRTASSASPRLSAECAQRGIAAQKIKWMREAGKTQQDQLAAGKDSPDLIADVYNRQGSSVQVRAAIEQDCMAEQDRNAQAAALVGAANKAKAGNGAASAPAGGAAATPAVAAQPAPDNAAAAKAASCKALKSQLDVIRSQQRTGGSVAALDALRQQYSDTTGKIRATGC